MSFRTPPRWAAWRHLDAREGFEVVFVRSDGDGYGLEGGTAAVEKSEAWAVDYEITVTADWSTASAVVSGRSESGRTERRLETNGAGRHGVPGHRTSCYVIAKQAAR